MRADEGWLDLAVMLALYSRRLLGCPVSDRVNVQFVADSLDTAADVWRVRPAGIVYRSDRGS